MQTGNVTNCLYSNCWMYVVGNLKCRVNICYNVNNFRPPGTVLILIDKYTSSNLIVVGIGVQTT